MNYYAWKNRDYITEDHKRYEQYLIWKYKNNTKRRVNKRTEENY